MSRRAKKVTDLAKLIIVLSLWFSAFSAAVKAQASADKSLNARQTANLITALKDALQENLAVSETNDKKYAAVTQKWHARKDLTGKSKRQIINLLYEDVKAIVTDAGMQYQISQAFSLYKQMPDEQFSDQPASPVAAGSKPQAVERLVQLTYPHHPYVGIEAELAKLPGTKDVEAAKAADRKNRIEGFDAALQENTKLNAAQKTFVRANYDQIITITDKITEAAINKNFPTERWISEGLSQIYSTKFTAHELNDLIEFLGSDKGAQILKYIRQKNMEQLITGNGGKFDFTAADLAEHDKFATTALGKRFLAAFLDGTIAFEQRKENEARAKPDADGFAIYESANLNKLFNKFVADNYKK